MDSDFLHYFTTQKYLTPLCHEERNAQMDAADPRIDYLSGIDSTRNHVLYGALLGSKGISCSKF